MILREISLAKSNLVTADEFRLLYEGDKSMQKVADIYEAYDREKSKKLLFDFDALLVESHRLLSENDDVRDKYKGTGSITASTTTPRDVFKSAILANAVAIILCHNHPSGDLVPSDADIEITKQLIAAGELLGIKVLDYLIVSNQGYQSLRDYYNFQD